MSFPDNLIDEKGEYGSYEKPNQVMIAESTSVSDLIKHLPINDD